MFILGVIIEVINTRSLGAWYTGRFIAGLGMGGQSVVVPMYSAEMTPKEIRGRCGSFYQWLYTWGILVAYWVDYVSFLDTAAAKKLVTNHQYRVSPPTTPFPELPVNGRSPLGFNWSLQEFS